MDLFASEEEIRKKSLKKKKEKLVNELKAIILNIFMKIQTLDALTCDPIQKTHFEEFEKFAELNKLLDLLLEKWIKNELKGEETSRLCNLLFLEGANSIKKELRSYSQYLSDLEFDIEKYEINSDEKILPFAVEVLPLVKTDALEILELFKKLREKIKEIMDVFIRETNDIALLTLISGAAINSDEWIVLPGNSWGDYSYPDLLVSEEIFYKGENWYEAHRILNKEGCFMLTIRQFVDFLLLLKSGKAIDRRGNPIKSEKLYQIYTKILEFKKPNISEWLDANFIALRDEININYNHRIVKGVLRPQNSELLEDCLMENCCVNLDSFNKQGLPTRRSDTYEIEYWHPRGFNNSVAMFSKSPVYGRGIDCCAHPHYFDAMLGVRKARIKP